MATKTNLMIDLDKILEQMELIKNYSDQDHDEADALAHAICDISESFTKIYQELVPMLFSTTSENAKEEILFELREEFSHILYHVSDSKFLSNNVHIALNYGDSAT